MQVTSCLRGKTLCLRSFDLAETLFDVDDVLFNHAYFLVFVEYLLRYLHKYRITSHNYLKFLVIRSHEKKIEDPETQK